LIGFWVGPRTVLDAVVKGKISSPRRESNPRTAVVQPVALRDIIPTPSKGKIHYRITEHSV
jgi:hypothetical protein